MKLVSKLNLYIIGRKRGLSHGDVTRIILNVSGKLPHSVKPDDFRVCHIHPTFYDKKLVRDLTPEEYNEAKDKLMTYPVFKPRRYNKEVLQLMFE